MCWLESLWGSSLAGWSDSPLLSSLFSGFVGALIGGLIAGVFSILAVNRAHKHTLALEEQKQKELIKGYLQGIHDELESLSTGYQRTMGAVLDGLRDGNPLLYYYPASNDPFTIYEANASLLGQIDDPELRRMIVDVYARASGLLNSLRLNNELYARYEQELSLFHSTNVQAVKANADLVLSALVRYASQLRMFHRELKDALARLMERLNRMGFGTPPQNNG